MGYRQSGGMVPTYQRIGPDGLDLTRTRAMDEAATSKLIGAGLPVIRVTADASSETLPIVVWRNQPSPEAQAEAEALIGPAQHVI